MNVPEHILEIFLMPGDFYWGDENTRIRTVLGSCVAICFWHPIRREGGMCHYMLPQRNPNVPGPPGKLDGKYGTEAWDLFMKEFAHNKTKPKDYIVKLFGGASMFTENEKSYALSEFNMGQRNIDFAKKHVATFGLNVVSENLGGNKSRRIHFDIWSGNVWLKRQD